MATGLLLDFFGQAGEIYATLVMTILIFVIAEVLPKTAAFNMPGPHGARRWRGRSTRTVRVFSPVLQAVEWLVRVILRGFGMPVGNIQSILSPREELRGTVDLMHRAGVVEKLDRDMMGGLLDLRELVRVGRDGPSHQDGHARCRRAAAGRSSMPCLPPRSRRLPLWRGSPDNIIGVLHAKDLLARAARRRRRRHQDRHRCRWPRRPGSCPTRRRSTNSSRRSATARPRSRSWSTNMASSKGW